MKKHMKKISILLVACMLFSVLIACNRNSAAEDSLPDAQLAVQPIESDTADGTKPSGEPDAEPAAAADKAGDVTELTDETSAGEDATTPSTDNKSQEAGAAEKANGKATASNDNASNTSTGTSGSSGTTGTKPSTSTTKPTSPTSAPSKPSEPKPTEPAPTTPKPTEPTPTTPKPTEPTPTEPAPTEPAPTEPPKATVDTAALEAYGRQYAQSLGFTADTSLNLSNAGYFPGDVIPLNSTDEGYYQVAGSVQATYDNLMAADGTIDGARCNVIVEYDPVNSAGMGGNWYVIWVLYG